MEFAANTTASEDFLDAPLALQEEEDTLHQVSDATSTSSVESASPPAKKQRQKPGRKPRVVTTKRVATYYKRKDEIEELQDEIKQLKAQLQQAKDFAPFAPLATSMSRNRDLNTELKANHLMVAGTESLLSNFKYAMADPDASCPLNTYIHLPTDIGLRAEILRSMREAKLQDTFRFMAERTRLVDLSVTQGQNEQFNLPDGGLALHGFDVVHYDEGHSLREVYRALQAFMNQQEMSLSERLGILTVRESDEPDEFQFGQSRFHSTLPEGLEIESNTATFAGFIEATDSSPAFAIVAMDFIDQDDLFPHRTNNCGRKNVVGAFILSEVPTVTGTVIAMTRWWNIRVRPPSQALAKTLRKAMIERFQGWCDFMPKAMEDWLVAHPPAPHSTNEDTDS